jgi:light-regulated signal transduction histidine kinase (bacteriophytochrome)
VRGDGAGFEAQHARHLFGAFQRMHTAGQFEGDGIGLATVQHLVTRLGGRVWAEAEVEKGATFYFTLPGTGASV